MSNKCPLCGEFMGAFDTHYHKKKDGYVYKVEGKWNWWKENAIQSGRSVK